MYGKYRVNDTIASLSSYTSLHVYFQLIFITNLLKMLLRGYGLPKYCQICCPDLSYCFSGFEHRHSDYLLHMFLYLSAFSHWFYFCLHLLHFFPPLFHLPLNYLLYLAICVFGLQLAVLQSYFWICIQGSL